MKNRHVVIERSYGKYEVWAPCGREEDCLTYHSKVAECDSRYDAERVAKLLDKGR